MDEYAPYTEADRRQARRAEQRTLERKQRLQVGFARRNFLLTLLIAAATLTYLLIQDMSLNGMNVLLVFSGLAGFGWAWEVKILRKIQRSRA